MGLPSWPLVLTDLGTAAPLVTGALVELLAARQQPEDGEPYGRRSLYRDEVGEVMLATWRDGAECSPHDHGGGEGTVFVLTGAFSETDWVWRDGFLERGSHRRWQAGDAIRVASGGIHSMTAHGAGATLHCYRPAISGMRVFDPARRQTLAVRDDCGAWLPRDEALVTSRSSWQPGR